jgi:ATP/maltotriose-dependent transcriptional regulator MalT
VVPVVPSSGRRPLSVREAEVLEMVATGLSNEQVAARLGVTVHAVKFHLAGIYRKLGVANRTQAAGVYVRAAAGLPPDAGLVAPEARRGG